MKQISLLLSALFVIGCAQERYVVIPDESGQSGSLLVKPRGKNAGRTRSSLRLVNVRILGHRKRSAEVQEVKEIWRGPLDAHPIAVKKFTVYFLEGTNDLTPESTKTLEAVFEEIRKRTVADVVVIGHTDTVGAGELNDRLAETRAKTMQAELVRLGIDPESIKASGRGERDLKVANPGRSQRTAQSAGRNSSALSRGCTIELRRAQWCS
jgi:outer membrane protein OmpA-like peptidoglycan-associated protein